MHVVDMHIHAAHSSSSFQVIPIPSLIPEGYGAAEDPLIMRVSIIEGYGATEDPRISNERMPVYAAYAVPVMSCILTTYSDASRFTPAADREPPDSHQGVDVEI